jgi:hypothetical protein
MNIMASGQKKTNREEVSRPSSSITQLGTQVNLESDIAGLIFQKSWDIE